MKKKLIITLVFVLMLIALTSTGVYANYQSIGTGSSLADYDTTWIIGIRQMESAGKGMGLNETIDTTTALSTSGSNNIDVHLLKNTEYGAILLLGASDYGKQGASITARRMDKGATTRTGVQASTTGNKYGIYEMGYYNMAVNYNTGYEKTAGGGTDFLTNIAPRYINRYSSAVEKAGDATVSTKYWHNSEKCYVATGGHGFIRGGYGVFSCNYYNSGSYMDYARAGVVVGAGL